MSKVLNLWQGMTGTVLPFAGTTAPSGWLLCYGQAVSRTDYANLFAIIGTTYGAGDGSTTFVVPDLRGRIPAGKDNMGGTAAGRMTTVAGGVDAATLGAAGGASTHTLTSAQMPTHTHGVTVASGGAHTHDVQARQSTGGTLEGVQWSSTASTARTIDSAGLSAGSHTHTATAADAGSGNAHPNVQPTIVLNHIIKV